MKRLKVFLILLTFISSVLGIILNPWFLIITGSSVIGQVIIDRILKRQDPSHLSSVTVVTPVGFISEFEYVRSKIPLSAFWQKTTSNEEIVINSSLQDMRMSCTTCQNFDRKLAFGDPKKPWCLLSSKSRLVRDDKNAIDICKDYARDYDKDYGNFGVGPSHSP